MQNELMPTERAIELIRQGRSLALAGPQAELTRLPPGQWIGGTTPYFMVPQGGTIAPRGRVFASDLSALGEVTIAYHLADDMAGIVRDAPDNGLSYTIIPAGGHAHRRFAAEAANYPDAFLKPTVGWIAGVHLDEMGQVDPKVFDGRTGAVYTDGAVVAYLKLPAEQVATLEIVNLFEADDTDVLRFDVPGFSVTGCRVNGEPVAFAEYLRQRGLADGRLPLVGQYAGAGVNVSLQGVDADGTVRLYAPVFPGIDYHFARPVGDYAEAFRQRLGQTSPDGVVLGCNCILNFLYGKLDGQAIGGVAGPVTFGEIAYQLLNQTMVVVRIV